MLQSVLVQVRLEVVHGVRGCAGEEVKRSRSQEVGSGRISRQHGSASIQIGRERQLWGEKGPKDSSHGDENVTIGEDWEVRGGLGLESQT